MFINYILALAITFLGFYLGALLAFMAKEELKAGEKYFVLIKKLLLVLILVTTVTFLYLNNHYIWLIMVFVLAAYLIKKHNLFFNSIFLGVVFYLSNFSQNSFLIITSLIFIYTLPIGTLIFYYEKKQTTSVITKKIFNSNYLYLIIPIVLYFLKI